MSPKGFTLSEVLITLAIIGIVAAMTLPIIIKKYQHKVLEIQFKKAYTAILQAVYELPTEFTSCPSSAKTEIKDILFTKLNAVETGTYESLNYEFKTYNKQDTNVTIHSNCLDDIKNSFSPEWGIMPDGTVIAVCTNESYGTMISIDINGRKKTPNAFGHDLFFFHLTLDDCLPEPMEGQWRTCVDTDTTCDGGHFKWTTGICSKDSDSTENGFACTSYAISNICPDDSGKKYFECLP